MSRNSTIFDDPIYRFGAITGRAQIIAELTNHFEGDFIKDLDANVADILERHKRILMWFLQAKEELATDFEYWELEQTLSKSNARRESHNRGKTRKNRF